MLHPPKSFKSRRLGNNKARFIFPDQQTSFSFGLMLSGPKPQRAVGDSLQGHQADESFLPVTTRLSLIHMQIASTGPKVHHLMVSHKYA